MAAKGVRKLDLCKKVTVLAALIALAVFYKKNVSNLV